MKKLSDYKNEEAIDLWMDLLEPIGNILQNDRIKTAYKSGNSPLKIAQEIIKECRNDAVTILLRIDPEPINGLNIVVRLVDIIMEFDQSEELKDFFHSAGTVTKGASSGNATANTEDAEA